ncbi:MAG: hypothetical protein Q4A62_05465 [Eikenella sp.]|nr:hypothetical protein [Eikenella sp.]
MRGDNARKIEHLAGIFYPFKGNTADAVVDRAAKQTGEAEIPPQRRL